jgi:hypothetical protein
VIGYLHFDKDEDDHDNDDDSEDCPHHCHRNDPGLRTAGLSRFLVKKLNLAIRGNLRV